jgi:hypothetical protein
VRQGYLHRDPRDDLDGQRVHGVRYGDVLGSHQLDGLLSVHDLHRGSVHHRSRHRDDEPNLRRVPERWLQHRSQHHAMHDVHAVLPGAVRFDGWHEYDASGVLGLPDGYVHDSTELGHRLHG